MVVIIIIAGFIASLLIGAYLMPKTYNVEKSVIIIKPADAVKKYVADLNHYSKWNPWQQSDPTATNNITGSAGSAGHKYAWEGKKVGVGSLTLISSDEKHIHFDLEFIKPWKSKAKDNWLFEAWGDGNETKVTWQNSGELPWPVARLMGPMINKNLNHQFATGLANLKKMVEAG
ncbi:MAG TPA: SRPBCC family protein [Chitinophagaceae bacterium]|nr:SRPBCC family protein [Chitinophagaceae bacterium]